MKLIEKDKRNKVMEVLIITSFFVILVFGLFILSEIFIPIIMNFTSWIPILIEDYFIVNEGFKFFATTIIIIIFFQIIKAFIWLLTLLINVLKKLNKKYEDLKQNEE